jgi:hypothetical protein
VGREESAQARAEKSARTREMRQQRLIALACLVASVYYLVCAPPRGAVCGSAFCFAEESVRTRLYHTCNASKKKKKNCCAVAFQPFVREPEGGG